MAKTDATIGQNLQRLRGEMSQTAIANEMKNRGHRWTQPTVVAVEKGERPLRLAEAVDLAWILDQRLDALLRRGTDQEAEQVLQIPKSDLERILDVLVESTGVFETGAGGLRDLNLPITAWSAREELINALEKLESTRAEALRALELRESELAAAEDKLWTAIRTGHMGHDDESDG